MEAASGFEPLNRGFADLRLSHLATPPYKPAGARPNPSPRLEIMERETGFEPATPTLARLCSTTELFPHSNPSAANSAPIPKYPTECNKRATGVSTYVGLGSPCRRYLAASSGGVGLMKNPVPHSKPATLVSRGLISRGQWKRSRAGVLSGAEVRLRAHADRRTMETLH